MGVEPSRGSGFGPRTGSAGFSSGRTFPGVEVTEETPDGRKVLFDRCRSELVYQLLDVRRDSHRRNTLQRESFLASPPEEAGHSSPIRLPGVLIPDLREKELHEALLGLRIFLRDERREVRLEDVGKLAGVFVGLVDVGSDRRSQI